LAGWITEGGWMELVVQGAQPGRSFLVASIGAVAVFVGAGWAVTVSVALGSSKRSIVDALATALIIHRRMDVSAIKMNH